MDHTVFLKAATTLTKTEFSLTIIQAAITVRLIEVSLHLNYRKVYFAFQPLFAKGPTDCGTTKPANVISTSYGYNEADLSPFYAARQCAECVI